MIHVLNTLGAALVAGIAAFFLSIWLYPDDKWSAHSINEKEAVSAIFTILSISTAVIYFLLMV